ncbi:MAG: CoA transferase, partial [bacterium]
WGQDGPLASAAGHDLNYIALAGALGMIGRRGQAPTPPLNLVGDYGGGALYLAIGVLAALLEARTSGEGQVVDAAMVDGAASLMAPFFGLHAAGLHNGERGSNLLDSGAYFYDVYECADGKWISVAPIEQRFHDEFLRRIGIDPGTFPRQSERDRWGEARQRLAAVIKRRSRDAWCNVLLGTDACVAPVLSLHEVPMHPHMVERGTFVEVGGVVQPAPAPRFSRTSPDVPTPPSQAETDIGKVLADWGLTGT